MNTVDIDSKDIDSNIILDSNNTYNTEFLETLKKRILNMGQIEWESIITIIKKHKLAYTENKNGVFINMNTLNKKSIDEILTIVNYFEQFINKLNF